MRAQTNPDKVSGDKKPLEVRVNDQKSQLVQTVGQRLGEALTLENLGPLALEFMNKIVGPRLQRALGDGGTAPQRLTDQMATDLGDLVSKDQFMRAPPADADARPSVLDARQVQLVPNKGEGTHALKGMIDLGSHVLGDVLKKFDIPADGMPDAVAHAVQTGLDRRADLARPQTWLNIVPQMAAAAMAAQGGWQAKVAAAAMAGISSLASQPRVIEIEAEPVKALPKPTDRLEAPSTGHAKLLGDDDSARLTDATGDRRPGTLRGGVLGLADARVQSGDNRKLAGQTGDMFRALAEALGDDSGVLEELTRSMSSAAAKGVGAEPRLIDLSSVPAPQGFQWPDVDPKVADFANEVLGPAGLNVEVVGGNEVVAGHFLTVLGMAANVAGQELGRPVDLQDPRDQAAVLRVAVDSLAEVSPTAKALSEAFDSVSSIPDPQQAGFLRAQLGRHERSSVTTWVVEALTGREPQAMAAAKQKVAAALRDVEAQIEGLADVPPELANDRTSLVGQQQALEDPDSLLGQAVVKGGLHHLQYSEEEPHSPVEWARMARGTYDKAVNVVRERLDVAEASQEVAPHAASAVGRSALATIWNVAAEATGAPPLPTAGGGGAAGGPPNPPGPPGGGLPPGGPPGGGPPPGGPPGGGPPRRPGDIDSFDASDNYAASMGARVDKRDHKAEQRQSFDEVRAILNDPSLEFFDKMFLVMAMLIDRMRSKIEEDQIDQLDREEMMWINEQLAHEYQKEVEMAQRDIHELGKEVDKAAGAFTKAERNLKQLEATPEGERGPTFDKDLADAKQVFDGAKQNWGDHMGRFEKRKTVLNELRDARDAHRVQIASDRRSADIFAAKVKRNTHVVEMYMDLIKTFEEHKKRNLARMLN